MNIAKDLLICSVLIVMAISRLPAVLLVAGVSVVAGEKPDLDHASPRPAQPTMAIVAPGLEEAAAWATAALSKAEGIALFEREAISGLAAERLVGAADFLRPMAVSPADGILLLEEAGDLFSARLFSTHHGMRVWSAVYPRGGPDPWPHLVRSVGRAARKLAVPVDEVLPVGGTFLVEEENFPATGGWSRFRVEFNVIIRPPPLPHGILAP